MKTYDMTDYDLAMVLNDMMAAALLRFEDFTDSEKLQLRQLQTEACNRFINEHLEEPEDEQEAADYEEKGLMIIM